MIEKKYSTGDDLRSTDTLPKDGSLKRYSPHDKTNPSTQKPKRLRSAAALTAAIIASVVLAVDVYAYSNSYGLSFIMDIILIIHQLPMVLGVLFAWLGIAKRSSGLILTSAILLTVSALPLFQHFYFFGIAPIFEYIGYANQLSLNRKNAS